MHGQSTQAISRRTRSKSQAKNAWPWQSKKTLIGCSAACSCAKRSVERAMAHRTVAVTVGAGAASHTIFPLPFISLIRSTTNT